MRADTADASLLAVRRSRAASTAFASIYLTNLRRSVWPGGQLSECPVTLVPELGHDPHFSELIRRSPTRFRDLVA